MMKRFTTTVVLSGWWLLCGPIAPAQTHKVAKPESVVRAVGVYEWTGDLAKPNASRLIPVSLAINGKLEDAGVYMARPIPFALLPGNDYLLESAGMDRGSVALLYARHLAGDDSAYEDGWFGYGTYKPLAPAIAPKKQTALRAARTQGVISGGGDSSRPHLTRKDGSGGDESTTTASTKGSTGSNDADPDRPHLTRKDDSSATDAAKEQEARAEQQDPTDGSFGSCYTEWMEKLDASYDYIEMYRAKGITPRFPFRYLDRVNSPEKLEAYIDSVAVSDVAHTGRDNRKELNGAFVNMIRLLETGQPAGYKWDPRLKDTLLALVLHRYQNQQTGWWGESYKHDGKFEFVDDLSVTFHVVQALNGKVPLKDKLATTLFAVRDLNYPVGWLEAGQQTNHNNMDVVVLMRDTWPDMTEAQRKEGAATIRRMLHWCLTQSLQADGSFVTSAGGDDSVEEGTHFGVGFLARIGYFDKRKRFWTEEDFPEAEGRRQQIVAFIRAHQGSGAAGGTYYSSSLEELTH